MPTDAELFMEPDAAAILARLSEYLADQDIEIYLVGGYVRDALLGRRTHDIDLAVTGDAWDTARRVADALAGRFVPLDEAHQVARVVLPEGDRKWHIDMAAARGDIEDDLAKRDFTIDAIADRLGQPGEGWHRSKLIDPLGGLADLRAGVIRATGKATFRDDPARLLRAFRLAAELQFSIDTDTEAMIRRDAEGLATVAGERIRDELGRILETAQAAPSFRQLDSLGLLEILIPELAMSKGVEQPKEHYWDVFNHTLETVAAVERLLAALTRKVDLLDTLSSADQVAEHLAEDAGSGLSRRALMKMSALLHDVAKPQTRAIHEDGRLRFLGHAPQGAMIAETVLDRFRFSTREKKIVSRTIDQHLRPGHLSNAPELPTRRAIYRYFRDTGDVGIDTLFLSLADHLATRGPAFDIEGWLHHVKVTEYMLAKRFENTGTVSPPKLVDGHLLMETFRLGPGPRIGNLLEALREAQASGEVQSEADALDFVRKELRKDDATER